VEILISVCCNFRFDDVNDIFEDSNEGSFDEFEFVEMKTNS
jgi:hypothetical protein